MKKTTRSTSGSGFIVCPSCELGQVRSISPKDLRCCTCDYRMSNTIFELLTQISGLPEAMGNHSCECGHPEMHLLPDAIYHCPSCGAEVLSINAPPVFPKDGEKSEAYWCGWVDGRFAGIDNFARNPRLSAWKDDLDRLEYYRGHRAGHNTRQAQTSRTRS